METVASAPSCRTNFGSSISSFVRKTRLSPSSRRRLRHFTQIKFKMVEPSPLVHRSLQRRLSVIRSKKRVLVNKLTSCLISWQASKASATSRWTATTTISSCWQLRTSSDSCLTRILCLKVEQLSKNQSRVYYASVMTCVTSLQLSWPKVTSMLMRLLRRSLMRNWKSQMRLTPKKLTRWTPSYSRRLSATCSSKSNSMKSRMPTVLSRLAWARMTSTSSRRCNYLRGVWSRSAPCTRML